MDSLEKLAFVFLGWLLATLSPVIADSIRRHREMKETKVALLAELSELRYRLSIVVIKIEQDFGRIDRALLKALQPVVTEYRGSMPSESVVKLVEMMASLREDQFAAFVQHAAKPAGSGLSLKAYPAPFLENRLKVVSWLPGRIQALMLEIHTQLQILEMERQNSEYYFRLTFGAGLSSENRAIVTRNLDDTYRNYSNIAGVLIERITQLESEWP